MYKYYLIRLPRIQSYPKAYSSYQRSTAEQPPIPAVVLDHSFPGSRLQAGCFCRLVQQVSRKVEIFYKYVVRGTIVLDREEVHSYYTVL